MYVGAKQPASPGAVRSQRNDQRGHRDVRPTDADDPHDTLPVKAAHDISQALIPLLSDVFALYLKTKNFHWHMTGPHFRNYHLMLDEQSDQIFSMTDVIAERARKLGCATIRSIGQISRFQRIVDNNDDYVKPLDMIAELPRPRHTANALRAC